MADSDLSGAVLDGRYKVIEPIADGAMGSVYRGERLMLGRAVAIKIMHHELPDELASRQRFEREAKLMALLEHPNCVSVIDFGLHDEKPYLVMDLVRGTSLLQLLEKTGRLEVGRAADISRQVLSGLSHAHELGIVHRDIKPANIMISEKAGFGLQVRILDFGLARLTESNIKLTTGIVVGTPNYMAPEQCKGGDIDARTDLYACGVILFEMLTGRKPFLAEDPIQVVRKHILEQPPTLASVDPAGNYGPFEEVVAKALAKAPRDRYESAAAMSSAIEAANRTATKLASAVFARAVPDSAATIGNQQATSSGWAVPVDERAPPSRPTGPPQQAATPSAATPPAATPPAATPPIGSSPHRDAAPSSGPHAAPDAPLRVPPTQPSRVSPRRGFPDLPFTRQQLMIGGAAVVGLIIVIALLAGGGGGRAKDSSTKTASRARTPTAVVKDEPSEDPLPKVVERAKALIESEEYDQAVGLLRSARARHPDSAELAFLAGKAYFRELWWSDGVDNFRDAIKLDDSYRNDADLLKTVLKGFLTTPDVDDRIVDFMRHDLGSAIRPYLEETADNHPKKALRIRAQRELDAQP